MKLKSVLKFSLPILAFSTIAIALPLSLVSCSDNKQDLSFKTNLNNKSIITNLGSDYELKVEPSGNIDNYGY